MTKKTLPTIQPRRVLAFSFIVLGLAWGCTVILPMLARIPAVQRRSQWLDDRGIDPTAMYYTELPVMEAILERQRSERSRSTIVEAMR